MNASKAKGTLFETAVVTYLRDHGFPWAERRALRGNKDCGDVSGIPGVVVEIKATKTIDLAGVMDELAAEVANADARYGIAVIKRRGKGVAAAYVVQTLATWAELEGDT